MLWSLHGRQQWDLQGKQYAEETKVCTLVILNLVFIFLQINLLTLQMEKITSGSDSVVNLRDNLILVGKKNYIMSKYI